MSVLAQTAFDEALKALLASSRLRLGRHLTLEELEAYRRAEVADDRRESIAEHLAVCEDCTILLLYGVIGPEDDADAAEEDAAQIEEAWNRLQSRLQNGSRRGRSLASLLTEKHLPPEKAVSLALEISRKLLALHSEGRVLPNLQTESVLISESGRAHLLDLGLAPTPQSLEVGYGGSAEETVIGLFRSLAPEQVAGEGLDERSNLFSLGVLLYEMFTGVSPFCDSTPLATVSRILSLEPPPASELNPTVDPAMSDLLTYLLAKDPADRPPSAAAVVREIESISGHRRPDLPESEDPWEVEREIERLYDHIIALTREQPLADTSARDAEIERSYAKLLELQTKEAERFRLRFEESLDMPIDAGEKILSRLRALREELEDSASQDPAAENADDPQASAKASP